MPVISQAFSQPGYEFFYEYFTRNSLIFCYSLSFAKTALTLLFWCKIICETVHGDLKDEAFVTLSKVSLVFYARVSSAENEKLAHRAFRMLVSMWRSHPDVLEKCFGKLLEVDTYQVG